MTFQRGMWAEAMHLATGALPFAAVALAGEFAIQLAAQTYKLPQVSNAVASALVWAYFAWVIHARTLSSSGMRLLPGDPPMFGSALRVVAISTLAFYSGFILALMMTAKLGVETQTAFWLFTFTSDPAVLAVHATRGFAMLFVWSLLGTVLPAFVAGRDSRFATAARRAIAQVE